MSEIRIRLLGGLSMSREGGTLPVITTHQARRLFAYLVLHQRQALHRDVVCGALWGEHPDAEARKALRGALWRVRTALEPSKQDRGSFIRVEGDHVGFPGTGTVWVDVWAFEAGVAGVAPGVDGELSSRDLARLQAAVALYRGDLLDGMYDECFTGYRERLRLAYLLAQEQLLADYQARHLWSAAIAAGQEILRCDPLRERVHERLMICHAARGDRSLALRQYESYDATMREELGVAPLPEIRELYTRLRSDDAAAGTVGRVDGRSGADSWGAPSDRLSSAEIDDALRSLHQLIARLESMREVRDDSKTMLGRR